MNFTQFFRVILARQRLVLGVTAAVMIAALGYTLLSRSTYVAELSLLLELKNSAEVLNGSQSAAQVDSGYLATQVDVIASHNVAAKVVDQLKLANNPLYRAQFQASGGDGAIRDWLADKLLENLTVKPSRESSVIKLTFAANDPRMAADVANAFADAYIATNLELRMDPARHEASWFDEQLLGLRKRWEAAQQRLSKYQQDNNVVGNDGRLDIENAQLTEISREIVVAQSAMYDAEARQKQVDSKQPFEQMPDVLGDSLLQNMKADLSRAESKLAEVEKHYGNNHPQYLGAKAEVDALRQKLAHEMSTVNGSLGQSVRIARQRTAELEKALVDQRSRILALKQQYDALDVLTREAQGAQRTYDAASQRGSEVRLESQLNQSSIAILNPAVIPRRTARSLFKKLAFAAVLGGILGVGAALASELVNPRVRSESDVFEGAGLAVLGEVVLNEPPPRWHALPLPFIRGLLPGPGGSLP